MRSYVPLEKHLKKEIVSHLHNFVNFRLTTDECRGSFQRSHKLMHSREKQALPHLSAQSKWTTRCMSGAAFALSHLTSMMAWPRNPETSEPKDCHPSKARPNFAGALETLILQK